MLLKNEEEEFARNVEAEHMFTALDTNNDGAITIDELQARTGLDTDKVCYRYFLSIILSLRDNSLSSPPPYHCQNTPVE